MFTILIADPYKHMREFLRRELAATGYRITEVKSHKDLFSGIRGRYPPDLIVMDLDLHHWQSMEYLKTIHDMIPAIPVIIYSNRTEYESHPQVVRAEAFIEKDSDPAVLMTAITDALRKHYSHRWTSKPGPTKTAFDPPDQ